MVLAPCSGILSLTTTLALVKHFPENKTLNLSWLCLLFLVMVGAFVGAAFFGREILQCGVVFCANHELEEGISTDPNGVFGSLGLGWLVLSTILGVTFVMTMIVVARPATIRKPQLLTSRLKLSQMRRVSAASCLAFFIIPICVLLTGLLPNKFKMFNLSGISAYMASEVKGAEVDQAWMRTLNVPLSNDVVLKLYPDTMLFYAFLEVLAVVSIFSALLPVFKKWLGKHGVGNFSIGECGVLLLFAALLSLWFFYWTHEHLYEGGVWTGSKEQIARAFGQTAVLFMSLTLLPATKNSLWLEALGISWEKSLWVHRWMGRACLIAMLGHVIGFWINWGSLGVLWHDILAIPTFYPWNSKTPPKVAVSDDWTIPMMEIIGYPSLLAMGLPWLWRRANYKIFKYFHYVFLALVPAVLLHATSGWYYMLGGVGFWLVDLAIRFITAVKPTKVLSLTAHDAEGGVTELRFEKVFQEPGQYCFVNVPAISAFDWHPFSLSSSPFDGFAQMFIKNMGPGTFTDKLYKLAKDHDEGSSLVLNVDGPYGSSLDPRGYSAILLIAGGIGITPMHSTFRMLSQLAQRQELPASLQLVRLIWIGRSMELFAILLDSLAQLNLPGKFEVVLYLTNGERTQQQLTEKSSAAVQASLDAKLEELGDPPLIPQIVSGRPCFDTMFEELEHFKDHGPVLVKGCGPEPMILASQKAARRRNHIVYESELFTL
eukprot:gnl/MRDRNA2_/MRDRNA2_60900_c0_seq1.p1 gnl/MRDRNA2_/MRDRNA2_60900_c0~~gnl/MRDRNA2_/MRDRNA2_60900_c0_seq1.p1  ORF type:complete len:829 (-),score=87.29 gnl/MRDRNA2_/MRDRNA2_60900_c0_seq1:59-2200(-)